METGDWRPEDGRRRLEAGSVLDILMFGHSKMRLCKFRQTFQTDLSLIHKL